MTTVRCALAVLAFAGVLGNPRSAHACSCMESGPPCESYFSVQAAFAGTVRSITPIGAQPTWGPSVRVDFEDAISFRGADAPAQSVVTSIDGAACGYPFKVGERYVVYASRSKPGEALRATICSRTRPIAEAADDLLFFKTLSDTPAGSRVFGTVRHTEFNLASRDSREYGPVPNVRLTLRNDAAAYQAATDAQGRYELTGVSVGTYQLTIEPPPEFASYDRVQQRIDLGDARECAEKNFAVRFDGRVRGLLRHPSGAPATNVRVQMMPIEHLDITGVPETMDATTDAAGRFEFGPVTPGRYVLGIELFRHLQPGPAVALPLTFHPGTPDPLRATIIDIRGGQRHDLVPMTLPPPLRAHRLTGTVRFADGTPAAGATVMLLDPVKKWMDLDEPIETDATGTFSFVVHEGLSYIVSATHSDRRTPGRRPIPTDVGPFVVTKAPAPLEIVVSRAP